MESVDHTKLNREQVEEIVEETVRDFLGDGRAAVESLASGAQELDQKILSATVTRANREGIGAIMEHMRTTLGDTMETLAVAIKNRRQAIEEMEARRQAMTAEIVAIEAGFKALQTLEHELQKLDKHTEIPAETTVEV